MPFCEMGVKLDLEPVTLDRSTIPREEVLKLREDHREAQHAYIRSLSGDFWSNGIGTLPGQSVSSVTQWNRPRREPGPATLSANHGTASRGPGGPVQYLERGYARRLTKSRRCANGRRARWTRGRDVSFVKRRDAVFRAAESESAGSTVNPPSPRRARSGAVVFRPARQLPRPGSPSGSRPCTC